MVLHMSFSKAVNSCVSEYYIFYTTNFIATQATVGNQQLKINLRRADLINEAAESTASEPGLSRPQD